MHKSKTIAAVSQTEIYKIAHFLKSIDLNTQCGMLQKIFLFGLKFEKTCGDQIPFWLLWPRKKLKYLLYFQNITFN